MDDTHPAPLLPTPDEVAAAYREELDPSQRSAFLAWAGFTGTFASVRGVTYSIRAGRGPFRNVHIGGRHIHHYLWGIGILAGVGAGSLRDPEISRRHPLVAVSYGGALALIVDEFALLLDLKDVYWLREGRISVDLGVGLAALGGTLLAASPVFSRLVRNRRPA